MGRWGRGTKKKDGEEEKSNDVIIDDNRNEPSELNNKTGSLAGDNVLAQSGQSDQHTITQASSGPRSLQSIFKTWSMDSLVKISGTLGANISDMKITAVKNIIFKSDLATMRIKEQSMTLFK